MGKCSEEDWRQVEAHQALSVTINPSLQNTYHCNSIIKSNWQRPALIQSLHRLTQGSTRENSDYDAPIMRKHIHQPDSHSHCIEFDLLLRKEEV